MTTLVHVPDTHETLAAAPPRRRGDDFVLALRTAAARRPPLPLRVLTAAQAAIAVRHAVDEGLSVELGAYPVEDGLALDLSGMKRIVIDPRARTARVQPGVTVAELEDAAAAHGLAPRVEAGRLTDLLAAKIVTRAGTIVRASADEGRGMLGLVHDGTLLGFVVEATYRLS